MFANSSIVLFAALRVRMFCLISEKTSGSKMLKKARSFREDIKVLIKRRPSSSSQHGSSPGSGKPKIHVTRAGSLGDGHDDVSCSVALNM